MKYFTEKLLAKMNSDLPQEEQKADIQWQINLQSYWEKFKSLKTRINKKTYDFLEAHSFHDYRPVSLEIIHENFGIKNPIIIHIVLTDEINTWKISYKGVKKLLTDYESKKTLFADRRGMDCWLYDELLVVDEDTLSHEILFGSGAKLLLHFKNKGISIAKLKKPL